MRVRIHRGTQEIGGTCIELEVDGARLLLDLGLPLDGGLSDGSFHPWIDGLSGNGDLLGLVLSHGHIDHWGLAPLAGPDLPVALGAATLRILQAAAPFVPRPYVPPRPIEFVDGGSVHFGPFRVTPHLVDHSAYDAHAIEVEADGKRLFYSGDIRGHGRKAALFEKMLTHPPKNVDVMLMEGSSFGRLDPDRSFPAEAEVEQRFVELFGQSEGLALVAASAQNIDRMVSLYRACKRTGRTLIIDLYTAEILRATENANIPQSGWPNVAVYHRGASIFRIDDKGDGTVSPKTHVKYLVRQQQVLAELIEGSFKSSKEIVWSRYDSQRTLADMMRSATDLAGVEKAGLHPLILGSPHVIDVEVSLDRAGNEAPAEMTPTQDAGRPGRSEARPQDRLDVTTVERQGDDIAIVFHEAKHFTNPALRARRGTPDVLNQLRRYRRTIIQHSDALLDRYQATCRALVRIAAMRERLCTDREMVVREIGPLIGDVANGEAQLTIDPNPRLLIFGFDADQKNGGLNAMLAGIKAAEPTLPIYAVGAPTTSTGAFRPIPPSMRGANETPDLSS
jgi:L-ascorbate metabolism protein UlaG (beta-lactamase superfamily)